MISLRRTVVCIGLLPTLLLGQKAPSTDWTKASISPMDLAAKADDRLNHLTHTSLDYVYGLNTEIGNGHCLERCAIMSGSKYRIEYPIVGKTENEGLTEASAIRNSNNTVQYTMPVRGGKYTKKVFGSSFSAFTGTPNVANWWTDNVRILLNAIPSGSKPLEALVKSVQGSSEYSVEADKKVQLGKNGLPITYYRLFIRRNAKYVPAKGTLYYEIKIGDVYYFPLSMTNSRTVGKKHFSTLMLYNRWIPVVNQKWQKGDFDQSLTKIVPNSLMHMTG